MKKFKKIVISSIIIAIIIIALGGCSSAKSKKGVLTVLEQWQQVDENFDAVIKAIDDNSSGVVELRVIELDSKGYLKKYEFVGLKDGKEFLVYDEDGDLKN